MNSEILYNSKVIGLWYDMDPYGWIWAHIETGLSPMAQDHLWTPFEPQTTYGRVQNKSQSDKGLP